MSEPAALQDWMNSLKDTCIFALNSSGEITLWNHTAESLTGYQANEIMLQPFCSILTSESERCIEAMILSTTSSTCVISLKTVRRGVIKMRIEGSVRQHPQNGHFLGFLCIATEMTDTSDIPNAREAMNDLNIMGQFLKETRMIIDESNSPMFGVDNYGIINEWNKKMAQITGCTKEHSHGLNFMDAFVLPQFHLDIELVFNNALQGNGASFELEIQGGDGYPLHLLVNVSTKRNVEGIINGLFCIAEDITESAQHERAVANTAKELRQLVDTANVPIFGIDLYGNINEWNNKTADISGYSADEAFNRPLVETFILPELRESVTNIFKNGLEGIGISNYNLEFRTKSKDILYLLITITTRRDPENNIVGVVCVAQDITETCKHERAVVATANELRQLIDTANAPIFGIDVDGDVNEWNDKTVEITGFTKEESFDRNLVENFIVPSLRSSVQNVLDKALQGIETSNYELEFRTKSNEIRYLLVNATTRRDDENNIVGVVGVAQDITEAVDRDRAVASIANELRHLIETANAPIFGVDCDGAVNEWNKKTAEITGYTKEEAFDEALVKTFIAPAMRKQVAAMMKEALIGKQVSNFELEIISKSRDVKILLVNMTTRRNQNNEIVGGKIFITLFLKLRRDITNERLVVGVAQDVTEDRKRTKELREMHYLRASQEAKVETERNMTAYFAHELRNPLGAIDSALNAMPDDINDSARSLVDGMKLCSNFMSSIMNNLLDVRKMEEGKMTLKPAPMSLANLLDGIHHMLLPSVKPSVQFFKVNDTKGKDWVLGDKHRIQQVYTNVITNAIKYTTRGSITLSIRWEGRYVVFECADTGPGIPISEQRKLFERFVQRGGAPGTGLGLAIAKHLVDLSDGTIRFDSDPSVRPGTKCIVELPLEESEETRAMKTDEKMIESAISFLIIDDVKMNRTMLKRRIKRGIAPNAIIKEASTGEEALLICGTETFDVILVDQYMEEGGGVMVGTDVVFAMRRMKFDAVLIGCSGNDLNDQFIEAGADLVWQKPMPSNSKIIADVRAAMLQRKSLKPP
mmetsp:Transcript_3569/g.5524  ORF Transcript_3569/g.5524 Transcript_3569/m.5524 type:complete len:1042 (-) Transcript_3569:850-3975(-)